MGDFVRMTIAVPKDAYARLQESARREMRQPRQQAHWLLYQALGVEPGQAGKKRSRVEVRQDLSDAAAVS